MHGLIDCKGARWLVAVLHLLHCRPVTVCPVGVAHIYFLGASASTGECV